MKIGMPPICERPQRRTEPGVEELVGQRDLGVRRAGLLRKVTKPDAGRLPMTISRISSKRDSKIISPWSRYMHDSVVVHSARAILL